MERGDPTARTIASSLPLYLSDEILWESLPAIIPPLHLSRWGGARGWGHMPLAQLQQAQEERAEHRLHPDGDERRRIDRRSHIVQRAGVHRQPVIKDSAVDAQSDCRHDG